MITTPKHLLVPVDGSETSTHAAKYAWMLAKAFGAKVTLVHVMSHAIPGLSPHTKSMQLALEEEAKEVQAKLDAFKKDIFEDSPLVDDVILDGEVDKKIAQLANQDPYDMVVIGSQGKGAAIKRLFVGSVASSVVTNVGKPVLVVDHPDNFKME